MRTTVLGMRLQQSVEDTIYKVTIKPKGEVAIREAIDFNGVFVQVERNLADPLIAQPTIGADIISAQLLYVS